MRKWDYQKSSVFLEVLEIGGMPNNPPSKKDIMKSLIAQQLKELGFDTLEVANGVIVALHRALPTMEVMQAFRQIGFDFKPRLKRIDYTKILVMED